MNFVFSAPELISFMGFYSAYKVERGMANMILDALAGTDFDGLMENWEFGVGNVMHDIGLQMATMVKLRFPATPKEIFKHWNADEAIELWGDDGGMVYVIDPETIMVSYAPDLKGSRSKGINVPHELQPLGE